MITDHPPGGGSVVMRGFFMDFFCFPGGVCGAFAGGAHRSDADGTPAEERDEKIFLEACRFAAVKF